MSTRSFIFVRQPWTKTLLAIAVLGIFSSLSDALMVVSVNAAGAANKLDSAGAAEIQPAVDAVYPALVRISVVFEEGGNGRMQKNRASGSGAIISKDGYIITNHHVAGRATRIVCRLSNREEVDAVLVGTDPLCDIAVIKLDLSSRRDPQAPLPVAKFGDSDKLKIGDVVLAMGCPSGLSQSVTRGIVANTEMIMPNSGEFVLDGENVGEIVRWIGHDAVIYHGNSGGPLVNLRGEIVGINEIGIATMGGAIPSNLAQAVAKEIITRGAVSRSWVGLEVQPLLKQMSLTKGVLVSSVLPDSPARAAGILPGDVIAGFNGTDIAESRSPEDIPLFNRLVLTTPVGGKIEFKGLRDNKAMTWTLVTVAREPTKAKEGALKNWGLTVRNFTRMSALENQRKDKSGVIVDSVHSGGPCAESKPALQRDDIIVRAADTEIKDTASLVDFTRKFVEGLSEPKPLLVTLERESQQLATVVMIGPEVQADKPARAAKAWLGADTQVLTSDLADALGLEGKKGVRITRVVEDSAASHAGLKVGDVLLALDGRVIPASTQSDQELFGNLIQEYHQDDEVEISGFRGKTTLKCTAKLGRQPKPDSELEEYKDEQFEFKARELSFKDRTEDKSGDQISGVHIVSVESGGWAALAGLSSGDTLICMGGQTTDSIAALKKTLAQLRDTKPRRIQLFIKRGIRTSFLELEPKW